MLFDRHDDDASLNRDSNIALKNHKNLVLLSPNFAIPRVQSAFLEIRLRDLAKNNAVEFSIRIIQLTRF